MLRLNISVLHFSLSVHILVSDSSMGLIWANVNKHLKNYSIWKLNLQKTKQSPILYTRKRNRTRTEQVGYGIISFVKPYLTRFVKWCRRQVSRVSYILAHVLVLFIDLDARLPFTVLCLFTTDTTLDWGNSMTFSFLCSNYCDICQRPSFISSLNRGWKRKSHYLLSSIAIYISYQNVGTTNKEGLL